MPLLRASAKMWAAFAPLNVAGLESYSLDAVAAFLPAAALCFRVAGACGGDSALRHNKRMHATRDTSGVINSKGLGGRVMRGVRTA